MISNGNFHPMVLAIACDALRIASPTLGSSASAGFRISGMGACNS